MSNASIMDVLIENITTDQNLLNGIEKKVQEAKDEKRAITDRLKDYRKDISVLLKYADEQQRAKLDELGFSTGDVDHGLNPVATLTLELLMQAKDQTLSNGALYEAYVDTFTNKDEAVSYTEFNIKCRPLYNTQRILRKKSKDSKSSREDMIAINEPAAANVQKKTAKAKS